MITALALASLLQVAQATPDPAKTLIGPTLDQALNYDVNKSPHINPGQIRDGDPSLRRQAPAQDDARYIPIDELTEMVRASAPAPQKTDEKPAPKP